MRRIDSAARDPERRRGHAVASQRRVALDLLQPARDTLQFNIQLRFVTCLRVLLAVEGDLGPFRRYRLNRIGYESETVVRDSVRPLPVIAEPLPNERGDVNDDKLALLLLTDQVRGAHESAERRDVGAGDLVLVPGAEDRIHAELARRLDGTGVEFERGAPDRGAGRRRRQRGREVELEIDVFLGRNAEIGAGAVVRLVLAQ